MLNLSAQFSLVSKWDWAGFRSSFCRYNFIYAVSIARQRTTLFAPSDNSLSDSLSSLCYISTHDSIFPFDQGSSLLRHRTSAQSHRHFALQSTVQASFPALFLWSMLLFLGLFQTNENPLHDDQTVITSYVERAVQDNSLFYLLQRKAQNLLQSLNKTPGIAQFKV